MGENSSSSNEDIDTILQTLSQNVSVSLEKYTQQTTHHLNSSLKMKTQLTELQNHLQELLSSVQESLTQYSQELNTTLQSSSNLTSSLNSEIENYRTIHQNLENQIQLAVLDLQKEKEKLAISRGKLSDLELQYQELSMKLKQQQDILTESVSHYAAATSSLEARQSESEAATISLMGLLSRYEEQWRIHKQAAEEEEEQARDILSQAEEDFNTTQLNLENSIAAEKEKLNIIQQEIGKQRDEKKKIDEKLLKIREELQHEKLQEITLLKDIENLEKESQQLLISLKRLESDTEIYPTSEDDEFGKLRLAGIEELKRLKQSQLAVLEKQQNLKTLKLNPAKELQLVAEQRRSKTAELSRTRQANEDLKGEIHRYKEVYKKKCVQLFSAI